MGQNWSNRRSEGTFVARFFGPKVGQEINKWAKLFLNEVKSAKIFKNCKILKR